MEVPPVELSINVCPRDLGYFEATYRHVVDQLGDSVSHRRLVVDRGQGFGRFVGTNTSSHDERALDDTIERLDADGLVDAVDDVPWDDATTSDIAQRYFGDGDAPRRAASGSPIHQYLWALDTARHRHVLHLDNDMLAHCSDDGLWITDGLNVMHRNPHVAVITPEGGPPQATRPVEWLFGHRTRSSMSRADAWHVSDGISTRVMLIDTERLRTSAPFDDAVEGELLEQTLTRAFARQGIERWSRNDDHTWLIHPRRHNRNHERHLPGLIDLVENDLAPFRRSGYRWDLRTEGRHFMPWWARIQQRRFSGLIRRPHS